MAEKEYIERNAALEAIRNLYPGVPFTKRLMQKWHEENRSFMQCESAIERLPAADVRPVVRGKWEWMETGDADYEQFWICSNCGENSYWRSTYCPNCGAMMEKKKVGDEDCRAQKN